MRVMAKEVLKSAGIASLEAMLQAFVPQRLA
jgi:hypothetical protein